MKRILALLLLVVAVPASAQQAPADPPGPDQPAVEAAATDQTPVQKREETVFEKLAKDPHNQRYGRTYGDGWIPVPGTRSDVRFGGFIQLNVIHDFQNSGFPYGDFIPALIPVPTDDTTNTEFDARTSRGTFESRTYTDNAGSIKSMISMDFAGNETASSIQPRLRQAYVSWVGPQSNISFTAGQAWTTYLDLGVWPELFDLEGPNAMTGVRQGLLRGSYAFGEKKNLVFDLALEQPETAVANGNGLRDMPDLAARLNWQKDWGHLQGTAIGRQLVAESMAGEGKDSAFGWGLSLSGNWLVPGTKRTSAPSDDLGPRQDNIQFQIQGGSGIGRYVFDPGAAPTPQDAVYDDATAELTPLDQFGAFVAYHHWWTNKLRSAVIYGFVRMDNLEIQPETVLEGSTYAAANLIYRPFRRMDIGLEYYYGERSNKDGETGHANRVLLGVNFGF